MGEVLQMRSLGEFEGCKAIKELVDLRLVWAAAAGAQPAPAPATATARPPTCSRRRRTAAPRAEAPDLSEEADNHGRWVQEEEPTEVADLSEVWNDETGDTEAPVE